ncbi:MAG TPA: glycine--tRNA ligase subunit beta [Caulobacteraceae bacterium]|jgi:glycyl-tRNA synthetase beta chain
MPQLLLELFSEEIPARMQPGAARDLEKAAREHLARAGLGFERLATFAGPRRITLVVEGLPASQDDRLEERKGPRAGSPEAAMAGFLRSTGVERDSLTERDGVYFAQTLRQGRPTGMIIAEIVPAIVTGFPWPKSMTWGAGSLRWVRPLHRILCVFNGRIVELAVDGLESGDTSEGHRFMGSRLPFHALNFEAYESALSANFVVLDAEDRKRRILEGAAALCVEAGVVLVEDEGLLEEVAGMAEWPTPLLGRMDPGFLTLPPEVIRTSMRTHQRYFAVRPRGETHELAPNFIAVANIEASDGGSLIAAGNARVLSARLEDARFFLTEDLSRPLASRLERLKGVTFHAKLGSVFERTERIEALARHIAPLVAADPDLAATAARLAKADLATAMVGEFPELQGVMGGYYAAAEGQDEAVVAAIRDHYRPQGPAESPPSAPVTMAVALADKIDTILAFFSIGEAPTGSRDPYALRRAALGVIRIVLDNQLRLPLGAVIAASPYSGDGVMGFLADRLKVLMRDRGARHDLVDAVFALGDDDILRVVCRIDALAVFLATHDGGNLLTAFKRAGNILNAEARKGPLPEAPPGRPSEPAEETALFDALSASRPKIERALARDDFAAALEAMSRLRSPVDDFFDGVLVNSPVQAERENRLRLLNDVRAVMGQVADFSLVSS